jgi:hypothetical protein
MRVCLFEESWSDHLGKKVKLEVEQGDQCQAGRYGAVSEFGKRIIEMKDLAPDVLALGREAACCTDGRDGVGRGAVPAFRISPSCRTKRMQPAATIFRGRNDA